MKAQEIYANKNNLAQKIGNKKHFCAKPAQTKPMMTFPDAVKTCLRKYGDFSGRATRAEYWWWVLAMEDYEEYHDDDDGDDDEE